MEEQQYQLVSKEKLENYVEVKNIHRQLHIKIREFLIEKGLESEFYDEYYPESVELIKRLNELLLEEK